MRLGKTRRCWFHYESFVELSLCALLLTSAIANAHDRSLVWIHDGKWSKQSIELLHSMSTAQVYGLRPEDYLPPQLLQALSATPNPDDLSSQASLDAELSTAATRFITDLHYGRIDPRRAGFDLGRTRTDLDADAALAEIGRSPDVTVALEAIEPHFYHYQLLKDALLRYRWLESTHEISHLPPFTGHAPKLGDRYGGIGSLKSTLSALGDLSLEEFQQASGESIDAVLAAGIKRFQHRHGIAESGQITRATFDALSTPIAKRVRQIELSLERARWLPPFESPPIIVNIPQFKLFAFQLTTDRAANILQIPVIVGKAYPATRTPVFIGEMKYVVFRPFWNVPRSIAVRELIPKIVSAPGYLDRNHLEIVRGPSDQSPVVPPTHENIDALASGQLRLRQRPGVDNSLGLVKFLFPNSHDVYLHGTPMPSLFTQSSRAFSHGCVRVADPVALATYVLRNTTGDWTPAHIAAAMSGADSVGITLDKPIPVIIFYSTVLATEAGEVLFFDDVYGHDKKLEALLGWTHM